MKKLSMIFGLAFLFLVAGGAEESFAQRKFAQRGMRQRPFGNPDRKQRAERFDMLMKMKLVEVLDLSPEQGDKFLPAFNQYRSRNQRFLRARGEIMQSLARYVRTQMGNLETDENPEELTERQLQERLAKLAEIRRQQEANRDEFYKQTGAILSIRQAARLVVFEEMFAREILRNLPNP